MNPTPPVLPEASPSDVRRALRGQTSRARAALDAAADAGQRLRLPGNALPSVRYRLIRPEEPTQVFSFVRGLMEWHGFALQAANDLWLRNRFEVDRMAQRPLSESLAVILDLEQHRCGPACRQETA